LIQKPPFQISDLLLSLQIVPKSIDFTKEKLIPDDPKEKENFGTWAFIKMGKSQFLNHFLWILILSYLF
jgi:hypothetical protein